MHKLPNGASEGRQKVEERLTLAEQEEEEEEEKRLLERIKQAAKVSDETCPIPVYREGQNGEYRVKLSKCPYYKTTTPPIPIIPGTSHLFSTKGIPHRGACPHEQFFQMLHWY